ncbi:MAG: DNA repair protein RecO [SAR324 cluster bacterium]|nr:DNA repair protein RecO [SAR324 cluster bacterium]
MARKDIIEHEPSYMMHQMAYSETSQIVRIFSQNYGRVDLIAKGSKRPKSKFRSYLQPFLPLQLSWSGKSQLKTLRQAEIHGQYLARIQGKYLFSAYYLNELILSLLRMEDPYPNLFALYTSTLHDFSESKPIEPSLRQFEILMLSEIGYAINFTTEAHSQNPIETDMDYVFVVEKGFVSKQNQNPDSYGIKGHAIKAINEGNFSDQETLIAAKKILRLSIHYHLDGKELKSKKVFKAIEAQGG